MDLLTVINNYWSLLAAIVGTIIWFVRLEGLALNNKENTIRLEKELDELRIKHENLDSKLVQQLADVRESLARIEGALGVKSNG